MDELAQLKEQVAKLTQQLQGLSAERNQYRDEATTLKQQMEAGGGGRSPVPMYGHPFAGLVDNPQAIDAWVAQQIEGRLKDTLGKSGYVTNDYLTKDFLGSEPLMQLLNKAITSAYQAARGDAMHWRNFDRMVGTEKVGPDGKPTKPYAELSKYDSDYAKKVASILQEKKWGEPMHDKAQSFATDWRYPGGEKALEWAADLARMEMAQTAQAGQAATQTGQAAQGLI